MKRNVITLVVMLLMALHVHADEVMQKTADGTYVVNTTTLCQAKGYKSQTPVEVYIKDGAVVKVVALANKESKGYFAKVKKGLLPQYEGLKVSKAKKLTRKDNVDGTTGATYSSKAVQKNIKAALDYYAEHK